MIDVLDKPEIIRGRIGFIIDRLSYKALDELKDCDFLRCGELCDFLKLESVLVVTTGSESNKIPLLDYVNIDNVARAFMMDRIRDKLWETGIKWPAKNEII